MAVVVNNLKDGVDQAIETHSVIIRRLGMLPSSKTRDDAVALLEQAREIDTDARALIEKLSPRD